MQTEYTNSEVKNPIAHCVHTYSSAAARIRRAAQSAAVLGAALAGQESPTQFDESEGQQKPERGPLKRGNHPFQARHWLTFGETAENRTNRQSFPDEAKETEWKRCSCDAKHSAIPWNQPYGFESGS